VISNVRSKTKGRHQNKLREEVRTTTDG
jgi:hypothetical protein